MPTLVRAKPDSPIVRTQTTHQYKTSLKIAGRQGPTGTSVYKLPEPFIPALPELKGPKGP